MHALEIPATLSRHLREGRGTAKFRCEGLGLAACLAVRDYESCCRVVFQVLKLLITAQSKNNVQSASRISSKRQQHPKIGQSYLLGRPSILLRSGKRPKSRTGSRCAIALLIITAKPGAAFAKAEMQLRTRHAIHAQCSVGVRSEKACTS